MNDTSPLLVSVVIPVYNAASYLPEAVQSVLRERECAPLEILLIEDGSSDDSLAVAERLAAEHPEPIRLFRHPDGENRGAGASRNLGIREARGDLVCFLDADDYWLPGRLEGALSVLGADTTIDGVYDRTTCCFETPEEEAQFRERFGADAGEIKSLGVPPDELFDAYVGGRTGLWDTNGIVVRRSVFERVGLFDESLRLRQDGQLWYRMVALLRLAPSPLNRPVAVYRRHGANRFNPRERQVDPARVAAQEVAVWESLYRWFYAYPVLPARQRLFLKAFLIALGRRGYLRRAWAVARERGAIFLFLYAVRGFVPGPRTLRKKLSRFFG